jgi:hypothetical protein
MPIRKLRALPDDDDSLWLAPDDPRLWPTIAEVWSLAARLCPPRFPPGVHKHRSIEDANRETLEWERDAIRRQSARRS